MDVAEPPAVVGGPVERAPSGPVGVLALQGGFDAHCALLAGLGVETRLVRTPDDLHGLGGLVIPGGESTVMALGLEREALADPLRRLGAAGLPMLGTCAGMIMLGREHLGLIDISVERNAFGRQVRSFETSLELRGIEGAPVRGVFIRAPRIVDAGPGVEILASVDGAAVAARQGAITVVAFHPELAGETRIHASWLRDVAAAVG